MRDIPIDRIMTPDPATIGPNDTAARVRRLLESNVIHPLPVVDRRRRLIGIVTSSDLIGKLLELLPSSEPVLP